MREVLVRVCRSKLKLNHFELAPSGGCQLLCAFLKMVILAGNGTAPVTIFFNYDRVKLHFFAKL